MTPSTMEKVFRPNRWFVLFCALFLLVCGAYQFVGNLRLVEAAKQEGADVFTWEWPARYLRSRAVIKETSIVSKSDTEGVVKVKGRQSTVNVLKDKLEFSECNACLTFYKKSGEWLLGKVEFR